MKVAILDGYNLLHRARFGMKQGDNHIVYSFFRSLRPLIEEISPDITYVVLEGSPKKRLMLDSEYKANRKIDDDDPRAAEMKEFRRQKSIALDVLKSMPIEIVYHPDHECDDVIAHIVTDVHPQDQKVIVSSDTDFLQIFRMNNSVKIYNPVKKSYLAQPEYDYVMWKALRGDKTDNIPGIPGIGDVTAENLTRNPEALRTWIGENPSLVETLKRNISLVSFEKVDGDKMEISHPEVNWEVVYDRFKEMGFWSIINQTSWSKYVKTFDKRCL